jgi:hypothetical protein
MTEIRDKRAVSPASAPANGFKLLPFVFFGVVGLVLWLGV